LHFGKLFHLKFKGDRVEIGNNVKILDGSYVTSDSRIPDNSIIAGKPAKFLEENSEAMDLYMPEYCNNYYKNLIITQPISVSKEKREAA
jgi:carbonic anhydrase/acetyltransferase-like protein (isoleucine patch superfamily)